MMINELKLNIKIIIMCMLLLVAFTGCGKTSANSGETTASTEVNETTDTSDGDITEDINSENKTAIASEENTEGDTISKSSETKVLNENETINPLTGEIVSTDSLATRPLVVMLDNQYAARPQAGLIEADVAYEFLAEGLITRYMGVFLGSMPEHIGPIRSARPYFIKKALEYNPYYVHVGGSMQALSDIKSYQMADIDGLYSGAFHRESHKKIPHNMYSEAETLISDGNDKGYYTTVDINFLDFNSEFTPLSSYEEDVITAENIKFVYKSPTSTDSVGYYTSYRYDAENNVYLRYTNGKPHIDEDTDVQLYAKNILVQYVDTNVIDSEGRLSLDLIGTGKGMYYTGGEGISVTWEKENARATTYFYDASGNKISLNPGKTWFQIMKLSSKEMVE